MAQCVTWLILSCWHCQAQWCNQDTVLFPMWSREGFALSIMSLFNKIYSWSEKIAKLCYGAHWPHGYLPHTQSQAKALATELMTGWLWTKPSNDIMAHIWFHWWQDISAVIKWDNSQIVQLFESWISQTGWVFIPPFNILHDHILSTNYMTTLWLGQKLVRKEAGAWKLSVEPFIVLSTSKLQSKSTAWLVGWSW